MHKVSARQKVLQDLNMEDSFSNAEVARVKELPLTAHLVCAYGGEEGEIVCVCVCVCVCICFVELMQLSPTPCGYEPLSRDLILHVDADPYE